MGVMEKMRNSTGIVLWIVIISFGILWMLQTTGVFRSVGGGPRSLGSVNGQKISYKDYENRINYYTTQYSQQTGKSLTPEMRAYYQDQAWNSLVTEKLLDQKMNQLGIDVTDQEVVNMIKGKNPDPFIRKQFTDKNGHFNRQALNAAIESKKNTPIWISIEKQLRQKKRREKLSNYVQSGIMVSKKEVDNYYKQHHTTADISFVRFPYAEVPDSSISVTTADLKKYYNNHKNDYKQKESYRFQYVSFDTTPTHADTMRAINEFKKIRSDFAKAQNDSLFLARYQSTTPYNPQFINNKDVKDSFKPVLKLKDGEVSHVIQANGQVYLLKKLAEKRHQVKFVTLSNQIKADPIETIDKRAKTADDFRYFAKQKGFESEAKRRNLNLKRAFATKGNDFVSGLGQSRQILDFLKESKEGDISKPIQLSDQFVVVHVTNVTPKGVRPFDQVKQQVRNAVINQKRQQQISQHIASLLKNNSSLKALASAAGKQVQSMADLTMSGEEIQGAGREPKVIGAIFNLKPNTLSPPIKGTNAIFVVKVTNRSDADLTKLTDSERQKIRKQLRQQEGASFGQTWLAQLKKNADIVDNRSKLIKNTD